MATLFLTPIEATYISQLKPNLSFGHTEFLNVGRATIPDDTYRTLLKFDISAIPDGNVILKATLRLFLQNKASTNVQSLEVKKLKSSFSDKTVTYDNAPEFEATRYTTLLTSDNENNYVYINITNLVQGWYLGSIANNGIGLTTTESQTSLLTFYGYEDEIKSLWPTLIIDYSSITNFLRLNNKAWSMDSKGITGAIGATDMFGLY
jgi:hypothetical protein